MSINDQRLAADVAATSKPAAELTLSDLLTQRVTQFANSDTAVEIIDKGVEKLFKDLVDDAFRSYGDFGKKLNEAFKASLPTNISEVIDLPKYNQMVVNLTREAWANSGVTSDMQQKVLALVEKFTSDEAIPKFIMASDLWAAFIEEHQERATEEQWEAPQVFVEDSDYGFIYVGLHPEAESQSRYSSCKKSSAHSCDFMIAFKPQEKREDRTETPVTHEGHQVYELFAGHMDNGVLGKKVIRAYSRFDKLVMALYYGGSFLAWDESPEDISYPGHDYYSLFARCAGHPGERIMTTDNQQQIIELEKQLHLRDAAIETLAAENATLRSAEKWLKHSPQGEEATLAADSAGASEEDALLAGMEAIIALMEVPATEAFINSVRAEGLEMAASEVDGWVGCDLLARELRKKAEALRSGKAS